MKKIISLIISTAMSLTVISAYNNSCASASSGISVAEHSPQEIKQYIDSHPFDDWADDGFATKPSTSYPYVTGALDDSSLQNALNTLNCMRYIAGLQEVSLNSEYNELAQSASLVNCVNNEVSHYPTQPDDMPDDIYANAYYGASHSNLFGAYISGFPYFLNVSYSITAYMNDSDSSNIARVGHRRWCLNPAMLETGFGAVENHSAMYAFDMQRNATETGVCWPAQNMPTDYFYSDTAWSISMGRYVDSEDVSVTLTRKSDSKEWIFSSSSADGDFYVDNSNRGQTGCIIFRPSGISDYYAGDVFDVKIEGLDEPVEYSVNFFSLDYITDEPAVYSPGDVNADGEINAKDASAILAEYSALSTQQASTFSDGQRKSADVNSDGEINSNDASVILSYYSYLSTGGEADISGWLNQH
ncbi:MAG: dockerin type I domain-containing protein [Ruminococcus flavefaciens]|nr:dockerin type I domain-containing protein [Ruminococcus flavefaciens]MCM1229531.1 dockerin type I domain-containing protein [Ruminococcus flavefaciens]